MAQTSAFFRGAAVASSLLLGGGYVALRAGWAEIPATQPDGRIIATVDGAGIPPPVSPTSPVMFSSSKSGMIYPLPSGVTFLPATEVQIIQPTPGGAGTTPPNVTLMGGSKYIAPLIPPKSAAPSQQVATPPKP